MGCRSNNVGWDWLLVIDVSWDLLIFYCDNFFYDYFGWLVCDIIYGGWDWVYCLK